MASRKHNLKHRYGITEEEYNQMLIQQKHSCKICGHKPDNQQCRTARQVSVEINHRQTFVCRPLSPDKSHPWSSVPQMQCSVRTHE